MAVKKKYVRVNTKVKVSKDNPKEFTIGYHSTWRNVDEQGDSKKLLDGLHEPFCAIIQILEKKGFDPKSISINFTKNL